MGRTAEALSAKQMATLEWIRDGCPIVDDETTISRRISARSLHRRRLVSIKGRGDAWNATITKAGLAWFEQHPNAQPAVVTADPADLFARVEAAGGNLHVGDGPAIKSAYQEQVRLANQSAARPKGWRVELKSAYWEGGPHAVVLARYWEDFVDLEPVPVPEQVARYHPAVNAFMADHDGQMVTKDHVPRAARILQAIVDEARRRAFDVLTAAQAKPELGSGARETVSGQLVLRTPGGLCGVSIRELSGRGGKPQERYYGYGRRPSGRPRWQDHRDTEFVSTGDLELSAEGPGIGFNAYKIRDSSTMALDERLPRVFRRIDMHRLDQEWREQERERAAAERRRRWEAAMVEANARYAEQARLDAFVEASQAWHRIQGHREFLVAARAAVRAIGGDGDDAVAAELDFAERRLAELDPLMQVSRLVPRVRDPSPRTSSRSSMAGARTDRRQAAGSAARMVALPRVAGCLHEFVRRTGPGTGPCKVIQSPNGEPRTRPPRA